MKKIVIASIIALAATAASALEIGVTASQDYASANRTAGGVTLGEKFGDVTATVGFSRTATGVTNQDRYSLVGSYDVAKFGPVTIAAQAGSAYLNNQVGESGYAVSVGASASVPVTKSVTATLSVANQRGQDRVQASDGNSVSAALKYSF